MTSPTVTERPSVLEPVSSDPFLDGLSGTSNLRPTPAEAASPAAPASPSRSNSSRASLHGRDRARRPRPRRKVRVQRTPARPVRRWPRRRTHRTLTRRRPLQPARLPLLPSQSSRRRCAVHLGGRGPSQEASMPTAPPQARAARAGRHADFDRRRPRHDARQRAREPPARPMPLPAGVRLRLISRTQGSATFLHSSSSHERRSDRLPRRAPRLRRGRGARPSSEAIRRRLRFAGAPSSR
jgi:hypothetical protein